MMRERKKIVTKEKWTITILKQINLNQHEQQNHWCEEHPRFMQGREKNSIEIEGRCDDNVPPRNRSTTRDQWKRQFWDHPHAGWRRKHNTERKNQDDTHMASRRQEQVRNENASGGFLVPKCKAMHGTLWREWDQPEMLEEEHGSVNTQAEGCD